MHGLLVSKAALDNKFIPELDQDWSTPREGLVLGV